MREDLKSFGQWLAEIGLESYAASFEENEVDFSVVATLNEVDLRELGLSLGARKKFMLAVTVLGTTANSVTTEERAVASPVVLESSSGERRQLTVMFCDLVGSTALSEKLDPEELRGLLHNYRMVCGEVIGRYEGFVARYVGDGILTYFGWPQAHEEDAERALRAALEIIQNVKSASTSETLAVRIGIATGPVVVGEQAGVGEQSKLAIGSTPNLAARLQSLATADQIVIASSTRRLVGNAFELADLGVHDLKGISEPVHAWRVMSVSEAASRFEAATDGFVTPLVGREQEIGLLFDRWQQAQEGEGQVVLLSGEPGIGKSRVMGTLRERLESQSVTALRFQCSPYHINSAFYPSIDNFERGLKLSRDQTAESKLDKLEALIVTYYGRPISDVRFIASLMSIPYEERYGALRMTPQKFKDETVRTLVDLCEANARKQLTVMLFEDAHWADPTSLEVLDLLIDRVKAIPLLIVLTHRPEFQSRWSRQGHVTALNLSKLTRAQSGAIVDKLTQGKELPAGLLDQILNKTDGVPLYVEELTKSILESGELKVVGNHYDYVGSSRSVTIPATLLDSLTARLDRFPAAKEVAQIGAAIGREFSHELLATVAPHTKTDLESALNQLTESGLAFRRGTLPDATYTFKHAMIRDAAYESMLKGKRIALHARLVDVLEEQTDVAPEVKAQHAEAAGLTERALGYYEQAGAQALDRPAYKEAIANLESAVRLCQAMGEALQWKRREQILHLQLGQALIANQGYQASATLRAFELALALADEIGEVLLQLPAVFGQWAGHYIRGARTGEFAKRYSVLAETQTDTGSRLVGLRILGLERFHEGRFGESLSLVRQSLASYDPVLHGDLVHRFGHDPRTAAANYEAWNLWHLGFPDQAARTSEDNLRWTREVDHANTTGIALIYGVTIPNIWLRRPARVESAAREALHLAEEKSLALWHAWAQIHLGWALSQQGKASGLDEIEIGLHEARQMGAGRFEPLHLGLAAEAYVCAERHDEAKASIAKAFAANERSNDAALAAELHRLRGTLFLSGNSAQRDAGEADLRRALEIAREQAAPSLQLRAARDLASQLADRGERRQANELLAPIYNCFTEGFDTKDLIEARALLDQLR